MEINHQKILLKNDLAYIDNSPDPIGCYYDTFGNGRISGLRFYLRDSTSTGIDLFNRYKLVPGDLICASCSYKATGHTWIDSIGAGYEVTYYKEIGFFYEWHENGNVRKTYQIVTDSLNTRYTIFEYSFSEFDSLEKVYRLVLTHDEGKDYWLYLDGKSIIYDRFNNLRREMTYKKGELYKEDIYYKSEKAGTAIYK